MKLPYCFGIALGNAKENPPRAGLCPGAPRLHRQKSGNTRGQRLRVGSSNYPGDNSDMQVSEKGTKSTQSLLTA